MTAIRAKLIRDLSLMDSSANRRKWAAYFVKHKVSVMAHADLLTGKGKEASRYAWMFGDILEIDQAHLRPDVGKLFALRYKVKFQHFSRTLAKLFWICGLPASKKGEAVDALFGWLTHPEEQVSVKVYSLYALAEATAIYPEIKNEILTAIESQSHIGKASWRYAAKKVLKQLQK